MGARSEVGNQIKCAVEQQKSKRIHRPSSFLFNKYLYGTGHKKKKGVCTPGIGIASIVITEKHFYIKDKDVFIFSF